MGDIKTYNIGNIGTAQFVIQSLDYQKLTEQIAEQQDLVADFQAVGKLDRALKAAQKLAELEQQLEQFKADVLRLYETFTKIEINTERLAQAKAYFDQGQFREADAILNAAAMAQDLDRLIARDEELALKIAEVKQQRSQLADEYVIKARLWATFYDQPNRFEQTCEYFEAALRAAETAEVQFEYALFLQKHNHLEQAKELYTSVLQHEQALVKEKSCDLPLSDLLRMVKTLNNLANLQFNQNDYASAQANYQAALEQYLALAQESRCTHLPDVARTMNNLAILESVQHHFDAAETHYEAALQYYQELTQEGSRIYLPDVATTLNNLANLQANQNDYASAQVNYERALQIRRELAQEDYRTYLPNVAGTLNNLAVLRLNQHDYINAQIYCYEALEHYRALVQENPYTYLPDVSMILNTLAVLQKKQNDYVHAQTNYEEALRLYRALAEENPCSFLPYVAGSLNNLANLQQNQNDYDNAQRNYEEALQIRRVLAEENPRNYLPDVAMTLINLSIFYLEAISNREQSIRLATEALQILQDFQGIAYLDHEIERARQVLQANGVEPETE